MGAGGDDVQLWAVHDADADAGRDEPGRQADVLRVGVSHLLHVLGQLLPAAHCHRPLLRSDPLHHQLRHPLHVAGRCSSVGLTAGCGCAVEWSAAQWGAAQWCAHQV